ncbi:MAG: hypothetical protein VX995_01295 [Thermoproteota archaeon]|jgi:hypothetical protein|nr:hypothetical protein [Thermoproteota archaeon]MEC9063194.1 hypothetical protein [Thermoproteota archaeon]MEC9416317.1 hypothetical protein [Thermoproteota archaeon]MED5282953.1 hypothetical protein [Thermoproteota archaeon]|tara:strand:+ start:1474 stop:1683 length:210 start_codon:yes stop_codon:yes gene_type:complete
MLSNLPFLAILFVGVFSIGLISMAEAHPHISLEVMNTHSHEVMSSQDFVIHTFEQVILFVGQLQAAIFR